MASKHAKACLVGRQEKIVPGSNIKICVCCGRQYNKKKEESGCKMYFIRMVDRNWLFWELDIPCISSSSSVV
jgi:hypothetical protein